MNRYTQYRIDIDEIDCPDLLRKLKFNFPLKVSQIKVATMAVSVLIHRVTYNMIKTAFEVYFNIALILINLDLLCDGLRKKQKRLEKFISYFYQGA